MSKDELKYRMEKDMRQFLEDIDSQCFKDQLESLSNLMNKYVHLNTCDYIMDHFDLRSIIGSAKTKFSIDSMPIFLGQKRKKVTQEELPHMMMVEATIRWLNKNNCLKKIPKFDKREGKL